MKYYSFPSIETREMRKEREREGELYLWNPIPYSRRWFIVVQFAGWFIPTQGYPSHGSRSPNIRYHWEHLYHAVTHLRAASVIYAARAYIALESSRRRKLSPWLFHRVPRNSSEFKERGGFELVVTNNEEESFLYLGCKIKLPPHRRRELLPSLLFPFSSAATLRLSLFLTNSRTFLQPLAESSLWKRFVQALDRHSSPHAEVKNSLMR